MKQEKEQRFEAVLERGDRALGWTVARVPFHARTVWPEMLRQRVCGSITGPEGEVAFRSSLFPLPEEAGMVVLVTRSMQQGSGVGPGEVGRFLLKPDLEPRPAELPDSLDALLDEVEGLRTWYGQLSESMRREIGKWINGPKSEDARMRRAEQMAERLLSAMDGEIELPPLVERAFRERPKARTGWARMTQTQRRAELLAVFYYQSPEAREKRVVKLVDTAEKRAG